MTVCLFFSEMNGQSDSDVDYKRKYKNLKRKLKFLVYVSVKASFHLYCVIVWCPTFAS